MNEPPDIVTGGNLAAASNSTGFDRGTSRKGILRKAVDYNASVIKYLENRVWQRDARDIPLVQPDSTYYNEMVIPLGLIESPINAVTTKFVRASTNKVRCPIFCTSWVPDGRRLITGAVSGEFTLWNGISFNFESIMQAHDCAVRSMTWSHQGTDWMVTTDDKGYVKYWQSNMNNVHTFQAHSEPVRCSSLSPTDAKLATCSDDGTVRIFDFIRCSEEFILRGHGADVKSVDWHPTKGLVVSGSKDNQQPVKLWDPRAGQSVCTLHAHKATVMCVKWNQNGNWLATAARDHLIKIFDIRMMKEMYVLKGHKNDVNTVAWHPVHESLFASGGSDGAILFWMVGHKREVGGMESAHESFIWSLSWHPLGHVLCSGSNDHTSKFWCRNRPGDEMKDKYNMAANPLVYQGDASDMNDVFTGVPLPGGKAGRNESQAISLPPPNARRPLPMDIGGLLLAPPPNTGAAGSRIPGRPNAADNLDMELQVPILGADIIAETFSEVNKVEPIVLHPPNGAIDFGQRSFGSPHMGNEPPSPFATGGGGAGPPPQSRPGFPPAGGRPPGERPGELRPPPPAALSPGVYGGDHVPPPHDRGYQGPPDLRGRGGEWADRNQYDRGEEFYGGRPPRGDFVERGGRMTNPFSWQRADYRGENRRQFEDDQRPFPREPMHNPYVYRRREETEPHQDPHQMGGGEGEHRRRGSQDRRPDWSDHQRLWTPGDNGPGGRRPGQGQNSGPSESDVPPEPFDRFRAEFRDRAPMPPAGGGAEFRDRAPVPPGGGGAEFRDRAPVPPGGGGGGHQQQYERQQFEEGGGRQGGGPPPRPYEGSRAPDGDEYRNEDKFHRGPLPPSRGGQFPPDRPIGEPGRPISFQQQDLQRPLPASQGELRGSGAIDTRQQDPRQPGMDPRQPGMDPRQPGMDPRQPGMELRQQGKDSRQPGIDSRQQGMDPRQQGMDSRHQGMDPRQQAIDLRQQALDSRPDSRQGMDPRQANVDLRQQQSMDLRQPPSGGDPRQSIDLRQQPIDSRQQSMDPRQLTMDPRQQAMDPRQQAMDSRQQSMDPRQPGLDPRQQAMDPRQPPRGPQSQREYPLERKGPPMHPEGGSGFGRVPIHLDDGIPPPRLPMRGAEEGMGGRPPMHPDGALSRVPMHPEEALPPHLEPEPYPPRSFQRQEQGSDDVFFRPGPPQPPGRFQGGGPQDYHPMDGYPDNERSTGGPRYPPDSQGPSGGQRYLPPESQGPPGGPRYPPPENQGPPGGQRYPLPGFQPGRGQGRGQGPPRGPPAPYGGPPNELAPSQDPRVGRGGAQQYPGRLDEEYDYQGGYGEEEDVEFQHDRAGLQPGGPVPGRRPLLQTPLPGSQQLREEGGGGERRDSRSRDRERGGRDGERGSVERDRGHHSPSPRDRRRASSDRDNPPKRPRKSDERDDKPKAGGGGRDRERKRK